MNIVKKLQTVSSTIRVASWDLSKTWKIIEEIGWGTKTTDYKAIKNKLMRTYSPEDMKKFYDSVSALTNRLSKAVDAYTEENKRHNLPYGGDDSYSDMLYHAVGMGKNYYDKALADPSTLQTLKVRESFSYAIPHESDYKHLKPDYHAQKAKQWLQEVMEPIKKTQGYSKVKALFKPLEDIVENIVNHKFSELPAAQDAYKIQNDVMEKLKDSNLTYRQVHELVSILEDRGYWLGNIAGAAKDSLKG